MCASLGVALAANSFGAPSASRLVFVILVASPVPHPTRTRILEHLRILPGDHLRSIARALRVSLGEIRYHIYILHRSGLVHEEKVRHRARYYAADPGPQAEYNRLFQKHWHHRDMRTRVFRAVEIQGAVRPTEVAKTMGISRQLATYHLSRLSASGQLSREDGHYRLPPGVSRFGPGGAFEDPSRRFGP